MSLHCETSLFLNVFITMFSEGKRKYFSTGLELNCCSEAAFHTHLQQSHELELQASPAAMAKAHTALETPKPILLFQHTGKLRM